jgi:hypothetical protein
MSRVVPIGDSKRIANEFGVDSEGTAIQPGAVPRPPFDPEAKYTARRGPRFELVKEEVEILRRVFEAMGERTSFDAPTEEKKAAFAQLLEDDPEIAALWERLGDLAAANDESVLLTLGAIERDEEEKGEKDPGT